VTFSWKNAGKPPAIDLKVGEEYLSSFSMRKLPGCDVLKKSPAVAYWVLQDGIFTDPLSDLPKSWMNPEIVTTSQSQVKSATLNVHGCVWYTDITTNTERATEFCFEGVFIQAIKPKAEPARVFFIPCLIFEPPNHIMSAVISH
jgi:hypothetical protein